MLSYPVKERLDDNYKNMQATFFCRNNFTTLYKYFVYDSMKLILLCLVSRLSDGPMGLLFSKSFVYNLFKQFYIGISCLILMLKDAMFKVKVYSRMANKVTIIYTYNFVVVVFLTWNNHSEKKNPYILPIRYFSLHI